MELGGHELRGRCWCNPKHERQAGLLVLKHDTLASRPGPRAGRSAYKIMKTYDRKICRGISSEAPNYSLPYRDRVWKLIHPVRLEFIADVNEKRVLFKDKVYLGRNVGSDASVLLTVQSWYPESSNFTDEDLKAQIYDALYDCATRDFWYAVEKDWQ